MSKIFTKPFRPLDYQTTPHDYTGDYNLGIYAVETTKRYIPGTRKLMWDGRVYKYAYANGAVVPYHGCRASEAAALSYTVNPVQVAKGERYITATVASRSEDDLAGGYITLYHSTIDNTTQYGIVGNEATSGTTTKIYVDSAIPYLSTTSFYHEIYENPYREVLESTNGYSAWVGVPAMNASSQYLWIQTWGPCLISGGESIDSPTSDYRCLRWGSNAALYTEASKANGQIAGYILNQGSTSIAGPMIMLMCST